MSNIYPIGQTCQYLLQRAARNRRADKYDQAMTLLTRARNEYPGDEDVELELAKTYDEMGCEADAARTYLRIVRRGGKHRALALFELAIASAQNADLTRALSYFEAFAASDRSGVSPQMAALLQKQLAEAIRRPKSKSRASRARLLERRAIERLHEGKIHAARRDVERAIRLKETPQRRLLKACCHLIQEEGALAVRDAQRALELKGAYVQALCVLADAYVLIGQEKLANKSLYRAARQAKANESLMSVAVECAKHGQDRLTLILTKRLLKRAPCHIRAMAMRACAQMNLGYIKQAEKLFGRLCVLMPEDSAFDAYYKMAKSGGMTDVHLTLAQDVPPQEAMDRGFHLLTTLHEEPSALRADKEKLTEICRCADWALHSPLAGENVTLIAVIILAALDTQETREVLFDALVDPHLDDSLKKSILQAVCAHCSEAPVYADLQGRLVRLAAGASVSFSREADACQDVVQRAANALMGRYPDAAKVLLELWIAYLNRYGIVRGRRTDACAAALEYVYHLKNNRRVSISRIAKRYAVSHRLMRSCARRILRAQEDQNDENELMTAMEEER